MEDFNDVLQAAEQLTAELDNYEMPRVQRNLRHIVEAGQEMLDRSGIEKVENEETKAAVFFGTKGVDITRLSQNLDHLLTTSTSVEKVEAAQEIGIETYLYNERMNALCNVVDMTSSVFVQELEEEIWNKIDKEWESDKAKIMKKLGGPMRSLNPDNDTTLHETELDVGKVLSSSESNYASEINNYNYADLNGLEKPNLLKKFENVSKNFGDKNIQSMWSSISCMGAKLPSKNVPKDVIKKRSSDYCATEFIKRAKGYLESSFLATMRSELWNNLNQTALGGIPSIIKIVKNYISLKKLDRHLCLEMGSGDFGPIWAIVYYCLRCGMALDAAEYLRNEVGNDEFAKVLEAYHSSDSYSLPFEIENKLIIEYSRVLKHSNKDIYKRAVYCLLTGCDTEYDHPEIAVLLDDYLWMKLCQVRIDNDNRYTRNYLTYSKFQEMIYTNYGEAHFDAFKQPYVYCQALILTGQLEAAIEFMCRVNGLRSHAVHIAIALNENDLLITSQSNCPLLIRVQDDPVGIRRINFCSLIVSYTDTLKSKHRKDALNYLYFLRRMKNEDGADLFPVTVSELIISTRDFDLLGVMNPDGCRSPGLLETMGISTLPIILHCAVESENSGNMEDAVVLYDLGGEHEQAVKVLIGLLAQYLSAEPVPDSPRQRVQSLAISLAERYQTQELKDIDKSIASTFHMLVDLMTFFDEFYSKKYKNALYVIEKVKIVPLSDAEVQRCVSSFQIFADEIRMSIPDVVLTTMQCLYEKYKKIKSDKPKQILSSTDKETESFLLDIKIKAKALITYCGLIPYFIPGDVYSKIMELEVQMN